MKKSIMAITAILAMALMFFSNGYANPLEEGTQAGIQAPVETDADVAAISEDQNFTFAGTINEKSQLVDEEGNTFNISSSAEGLELRSLVGKNVEVKGTVMEEEGQETIDVVEYKILKK